MSPPPKAAVYCGFFIISRGDSIRNSYVGTTCTICPSRRNVTACPSAEIHAEGNVTRCGRLYMNSAAGIIRTCFSYNGIQRKMPRIRPKRFLTAVSGKYGGAVRRATPGRPRSTVGPAGRAAPTARAGGWDRVTTLPPCIRRWPPNGTCGKTHRGSRPTFWRGATALRGGSVKRGTPGRHRSIPGCPAAAVPSVRDGSMDPAKSVMTGS